MGRNSAIVPRRRSGHCILPFRRNRTQRPEVRDFDCKGCKVFIKAETKPLKPLVNARLLLWMAEILHQLIGSLSHYLKAFKHPRWCRIFFPSTVGLVRTHVGPFSCWEMEQGIPGSKFAQAPLGLGCRHHHCHMWLLMHARETYMKFLPYII